MKVIEYDAGKAKQVRKFPSLHPLLCLPTRVLEECAHCLRVELGGCRNRCGSTVSLLTMLYLCTVLWVGLRLSCFRFLPFHAGLFICAMRFPTWRPCISVSLRSRHGECCARRFACILLSAGACFERGAGRLCFKRLHGRGRQALRIDTTGGGACRRALAYGGRRSDVRKVLTYPGHLLCHLIVDAIPTRPGAECPPPAFPLPFSSYPPLGVCLSPPCVCVCACLFDHRRLHIFVCRHHRSVFFPAHSCGSFQGRRAGQVKTREF